MCHFLDGFFREISGPKINISRPKVKMQAPKYIRNLKNEVTRKVYDHDRKYTIPKIESTLSIA